MHAYSNTEFQKTIPVITSNVSSNRIKIQEILLILQLETGYFSKLFISENAPFEAVALQSSQRLPELLFYTKKSYKILQSSNSSSNPTRAHYREFYMQKTKSSSSTTIQFQKFYA